MKTISIVALWVNMELFEEVIKGCAAKVFMSETPAISEDK